MGFFASWWERVPVKQLSTAIALVMIVSVIGVQVGNVPRSSIAAKVLLLLNKPAGEVWG